MKKEENVATFYEVWTYNMTRIVTPEHLVVLKLKPKWSLEIQKVWNEKCSNFFDGFLSTHYDNIWPVLLDGSLFWIKEYIKSMYTP